MNNNEEIDLDIQEIFNEVTKSFPKEPNSIPLQFELESLKEVFEFLLQFVTLLCKEFYSDDKGQVNLGTMNQEEFNIINKYMQSIGFTCSFQSVQANSNNTNYYYNNRYDCITITPNTMLKDLFFSIRCENTLFIISFDRI
jgi:hypothetical protein